MLLHLDSSLSNQAAHFLSRLTPGWLPCANCAQCNDMPGSNYFHHPHKGRGYETHHMLTFYTDFIFHFKCLCELAHVDSPESVKEKFCNWDENYQIRKVLSPVTQSFPQSKYTHITLILTFFLSDEYQGQLYSCHHGLSYFCFETIFFSEQEATHDIVLRLLDLIKFCCIWELSLSLIYTL